jgi:hypothetical protein
LCPSAWRYYREKVKNKKGKSKKCNNGNQAIRLSGGRISAIRVLGIRRKRSKGKGEKCGCLILDAGFSIRRMRRNSKVKTKSLKRQE